MVPVCPLRDELCSLTDELLKSQTRKLVIAALAIHRTATLVTMEEAHQSTAADHDDEETSGFAFLAVTENLINAGFALHLDWGALLEIDRIEADGSILCSVFSIKGSELLIQPNELWRTVVLNSEKNEMYGPRTQATRNAMETRRVIADALIADSRANPHAPLDPPLSSPSPL